MLILLLGIIWGASDTQAALLYWMCPSSLKSPYMCSVYSKQELQNLGCDTIGILRCASEKSFQAPTKVQHCRVESSNCLLQPKKKPCPKGMTRVHFNRAPSEGKTQLPSLPLCRSRKSVQTLVPNSTTEDDQSFSEGSAGPAEAN
ncbi:hypothetical protein K2X30_09585 [bacterium]|jgi:hypothetical protein|nr:hypothetical protein [bacterium]